MVCNGRRNVPVKNCFSTEVLSKGLALVHVPMSQLYASYVSIRVKTLTGVLPSGVTIWRLTCTSSTQSTHIQASQLELPFPVICMTHLTPTEEKKAGVPARSTFTFILDKENQPSSSYHNRNRSLLLVRQSPLLPH